MPSTRIAQAALPPPNRPLRLATLLRLRWLAIAGQTASVIFVAAVLKFPVPLFECAVLILLSVLLNLSLILRYGLGHRSSNWLAAAQLAFDILQIGGLLWLTGGLQNPFSLLLLAPVSVSASTLPRRLTFALVALVMVLASALAVFHLPLPWDPERPLVFNDLYVTGIWVALLCGVAFIAAYTSRVAHEARQLADALTATELALSRQQQLSALDGLAAAAAHELGTPLSTIALAAREMRSEVPEGAEAEDLDLILDQVGRCRAILGKLRKLGAEGGDPFEAVPLCELIEEVAKPYEHLGRTIRIATSSDRGSEPVVPRNVGLLYGLGNLIENAAHFAHERVDITANWDSATVSLTITDDGPGFQPELISQLGEPYLTTRPRRGAEDPEAMGGLGLGVFISKTLLERSGARLNFLNTQAEGHARVSIAWPRDVLTERTA